MTLAVEIEDRSTGETVVCQIDIEWDGPFWWKEGNGACDCNRHLFFERAKGNEPLVDDDDWDELTCGDGHYRIVSIKQAGVLLYEEPGEAA